MPNSVQYQTGDDGFARALLFVPANQMFHRRKFYREGRLWNNGATKLLPVKVADERSMAEGKDVKDGE